MTSFTYSGDITKAAQWLPFAKSRQMWMAKIGAMTQSYNPVSGIMITVQTVPMHIHIVVTGGEYEFFTPTSVANIYGLTSGHKFFGDAPSSRPVILKDALEALPVNTWYNIEHWVTGGVAVRYANARLPSAYWSYWPGATLDYPAKVFTSIDTVSFTSPSVINAAATHGNYCLGISTTGTVYVWDLATGTQIYSAAVEGSWLSDNSSEQDARGFWSFNRAGNKACTSVWVDQYQRFHGGTGTAFGWLTSYVVEVEFLFDAHGVFSDINVTQTETADFCIAADYDWTTVENALVMATISVFEYRTYLGKTWQATTNYALGDTFVKHKTASDNPAIQRPGYIDFVVDHSFFAQDACTNTGFPTGTLWTSGSAEPIEDCLNQQNGYLILRRQTVIGGYPAYDFSVGSPKEPWRYFNWNAYDITLKMVYRDGTVLKRVPLVHNMDHTTGFVPTAPDYHAIRGDAHAFYRVLTGLDLRVLGYSTYTRNVTSVSSTHIGTVAKEAVELEIFDASFINPADKVALTDTGETEYPGNYYWFPIAVGDTTRMENQTIAVVPSIPAYGDNGIILKEVAVYAIDPFIAETNDASSTTIDFKVSSEGVYTQRYHASTVNKYYTDAYNSRYFKAGAWATKLKG